MTGLGYFLKRSPSLLKAASRIWGPFLGAGVRIMNISPDFREIETRMKLHWYNKNIVGSHYGGSLYSMADPFYMMILLSNIGDKHYVWDKFASVEYVHPCKTEVRAQFNISGDEIERIVEMASDGKAHYVDFHVNVMNTEDNIVAKIKKTLYVKRKPGC